MNNIDLNLFFKDKSKKPKEKKEELSSLIINNQISTSEIIDFANSAKDPIKATCIEAYEYATKQKPEIATKELFEFAISNLTAKAPRVKWESSKVIGNTCGLFLDLLPIAIDNLLLNSKHDGTVVRWSTAFALAEILKLKTDLNNALLAAIEDIINLEEKESIKKIYIAAMKKIK